MKYSLSEHSSHIHGGLWGCASGLQPSNRYQGPRRWWSGLRVGLDTLTGAASERYRSLAGDTDVATLDELTGDDFSSATEERPKSVWLNPVALTMAAAVIASLVAARSLFGRGS